MEMKEKMEESECKKVRSVENEERYNFEVWKMGNVENRRRVANGQYGKCQA